MARLDSKNYFNLSTALLAAALLPQALGTACGKSDDGVPSVGGAVNFYNGATTAPKSSGLTQSLGTPVSRSDSGSASMLQSRAWSGSGSWYLAPNKMTATITGIAFGAVGADPHQAMGSIVPVSSCTVTFDSGQPSLAKLSSCSFAFPAGTYGSVTIAYSTTYQVLISDPANGIYTDPSQTYLLNTSAPAGGAQFVTVKDQNGMGDTNYSSTGLPAPLTISAGSSPTLSVVFDPTHWLTANVNNGNTGFSSKLNMSGGVPLYPIVGKIGKSVTLNDVGVMGNYQGNLVEIRVFYADSKTPWALQGKIDICRGANTMTSAWATSAKANNCSGIGGGCYGMGGYLGIDGSGVLSWGFPAFDWTYNTWAALLSVQIPSSVGATTTLSYVCSSSAPDPAGGATTYTTAPNLSSLGSVQTKTLTLMTN